MESTHTTCIYDMYGCKIGSTIYLKVNTDSDCVIWTFNGEKLESKSDLRKGFEKEDASCGDTGTYKCIIDNEERYVFDVHVYENYDTIECTVNSTINLKVHTDSKSATWTLNSKDVTSECNPQEGFEKKLAKFDDSGRYECTVDEKVIHAFDVVVFEYSMSFIGGEIRLDVKTDPSCTTWNLNGDNVKSEYPPGDIFVRHVQSFKDLGRYLCKVDGKVKVAFHVFQMEFVRCKIGSTIKLNMINVESRTCSPAWTLNKERLSSECREYNVLEKHNANFSDSGTYEWKLNGILRCVFDVCIYDDVEVDIGSTIYFEVNEDPHCPIWFFERQNIYSQCDPKKGFKKENAVLGDAGCYEGKVNGIVKYTFNVIIHDNVEIEIGSILHLLDKTSNVPQWTLNGKHVSTECKPEKGFEKGNADYSDSGRYEYKVSGMLKNVFDVVVYGSYKKYEFQFGSTIYLEVNSYITCPKWTLNGEKISTECCPHKGFEKKKADFRDSGKYRCKVGDKVTHVLEVIVYKNLFADEFLGIRFTVAESTSRKKTGIIALGAENTPEDLKSATLNISPDDGSGTPQFIEYNMTKNPRGIAVIVAIGTFDNFDDVSKMSAQNIKNCRATFEKLHFDIKECSDTTAKGILEFLEGISTNIKQEYDCFVLYVSTHGGHGYVCCKDCKKEPKTAAEKENGYIYISTLVEMFLPKKCKQLQGKPKLYFFDCCREESKNIHDGSIKAPIKVVDEAQSEFSDILIGYGALIGGSALGDYDLGSWYTYYLTTCLQAFGQTKPLTEVMHQVKHHMKKMYVMSEDLSTLCGSIEMKDLLAVKDI